MTSKQAYQQLLDRVFGAGRVTAAGPDDADNIITGAVRHHATSGKFGFFVEQLEARLRRLDTAFPRDPSRAEVLGKVARLALERNYSGTLAELAAYDLFAALTPVEAERAVPPERTLASEVPGRQGSSFDGELPDVGGLLFDVKSFSDVVSEIVRNIKTRVGRPPGLYKVTASYPLDLAHERVSAVFGPIVAGIKAAAAAGERGYHHPAVPELRFRLIPDPPPRVVSTEHEYSPDRLLGQMRYFVLNHFDQTLRDEPNLLVYVVHPWFNLVQSDFSGQADFYREYCRRVFTGLVDDTAPLEVAIPDRAPGVRMPVREVARRLGVIMVIEDRTVAAPDWYDPASPCGPLRAHLFVNLNAHPANAAESQCRRLAELAAGRGVRLQVEVP